MAPSVAYRGLQARVAMCRECLRSRAATPVQPQRRWIGTKYMAKLKVAEAEWRYSADEIRSGRKRHIWDEFQERGFVKDVVGSPEMIRKTMLEKRIGIYCGVDPTANSLHIGHLVAMMPVFWSYMHGYGAFTIIGGSTAKIGDPTGRVDGRPAMSSATLVQNLAGIQHQLKALWAHMEVVAARFQYQKNWAWRKGIINNNQWWNSLPMLEVMKRLGTPMRVGPLLGRDSVKTRLQEGSGMSFAEFSYPLMQAWDWYELYKQRGVQMQVGGSDQYGNILTGAQGVKHCVASEPNEADQLPRGELDQPMGFTVPLLTDSAGKKFGKSEGNAIWLDPFQTSPFDFYGYLVRRSDAEVEQLLKLLTFQPLKSIAKTMEQHNADPRKRVAQHLLAYEVSALVHGDKIAQETQIRHRAVYGQDRGSANIPITFAHEPGASDHMHSTVDNRPKADIQLPFHVLEQSLARIVYASGLSASVADAHRTIKARGLYIGGSPGQKPHENKGMLVEQLMYTPVTLWDPSHTPRFLIDGKILLLRKGKHNLRCIEFISDEEYAKTGRQYPGQPNTGAFRKARERMREIEQRAQTEQRQVTKEEHSLMQQVSEATQGLTNKQLREKWERLKEAGLIKDDDELI
ncbi:tRNA synthetases class I-domain-containing protein [Coniella lustricola]|uniref:Tyrosine--tRNA ligase n=1 Tax=Coniella lustricola TaxID=2025994 RepID=A0A2T2ZYK2_9PEZI|nr:tRNA synthetases class I-domain-containing protein [Coniella lustricola]